MAKKERKGAVIKRITHRITKREGVMRLDKDHMMFFARDPDLDETPDTRGTIARFESKDGDAVESWLLERLKKNLMPDKPLVWLPVIEVEVTEREEYYRRHSKDNDEQRQSEVRAEMNRYQIALTADRAEWRRLEWHQLDPASSTFVEVEDQLSTSDRYANGPKFVSARNSYRHSDEEIFALPSIRDGKAVVAYNDDLWAGLSQVFDNLDNTVKTIQSMLGTKKGLALIAEVGAGAKRLASGQMTTEEVPT